MIRASGAGPAQLGGRGTAEVCWQHCRRRTRDHVIIVGERKRYTQSEFQIRMTNNNCYNNNNNNNMNNDNNKQHSNIM